MSRLIASVALLATLLASAGRVQAQVGRNFDPADWEYGSRFEVDGDVPIWNPVMQKLRNGEPVIGGTIRATDPRTYCQMAAAGYDFTWMEMQHEATSWENAARMWFNCPGPAVPGVRIPHEGEENVQKPTDMGALVIVVPTVDTVEEAERAVEWTYFPPMGRRSNGGGQAFSQEMWGGVPGGYRATWNANVVLILMIETLEGVMNAREIAQVPGVDGLFAASGDLGNFSGYNQGDPEYEMLVSEVVAATQAAGIAACGPLAWMGTRPEFTCFQGGTEGANIRRGAEAEIQAAQARFSDAGGASSIGAVLADLSAECGQIIYEDDCYGAVRQAAAAAADLSMSDQDSIRERLRQIALDNPGQAGRIRDVASEAGLPISER